MPSEFTIRETKGDLAKIRKVMTEQANPREVRKQLSKWLTQATLDSRQKVKRKALEVLPKAGGLNRWAAILPRSVVRTTSKGVQLKITDRKSGHDLASIDRGRIRHPVFGNRKVWVNESVEPGFFSQTLEDEKPEIQARVRNDLDAWVRGLGRKTG